MKKFTFILILILLLSFSAFVSAKTNSFGINAGLVMPLGDLSDVYEMGYGFGGIFRMATGNPSMMVAMGVSYMALPGKTEKESGAGWSYEITYEDASMISIFAGPQLGKEQGVYFLPAITGNFDDGESRFGLDLGGGFLYPFGSGSTKFDISAKFSMTNLIGKEKGENAANVIRLNVGVAF